MSGLRVFELARKLKMSSKDLLVKMGQLKISAKSHLAGVDEQQAKRIENAVIAQRAHEAMQKRAAEHKPARKGSGTRTKSRRGKPHTARHPQKRKPSEHPAARRPSSERPVARRPASKPRKDIQSSSTEEQILPKETGPSSEKKTGRRRKGRAKDRIRSEAGEAERRARKKLAALRAQEAATPRKLQDAPRMSRRRAKAKKAARLAETAAAVAEREHRARIEIDELTTVEELAGKLGIEVNALILELMDHDILANKNQIIDISTIREIATAHEFETVVSATVEETMDIEDEDDPSLLEPRAPIVTVMGHVDHGKTSLLDLIRKTNVTSGEAGGITQHVGAYLVAVEHGKIVFLDTPGHEAFTAMRMRGAQLTDMVVLVVAADDGVKPQTIEAIHHARAADVKIVVAINKIDKPAADIERVKRELNQEGMVPDDWGGDTVCVNVSAATGEGVHDLLEMLLVQAEMMELKANPARRARGTIIEGFLDRGRGAVGHVLIQNGTLHVGDSFVAGLVHGRVRAMLDDLGRPIDQAPPATPVEVLGFDDVPRAGDIFITVDDERKARRISEERQGRHRRSEIAPSRAMSLEDLHRRIEQGETQTLNLVVKTDVQGSADALLPALEKLSGDKVRVNVIHSAVGGISESDVMLASASDAVIIGYHVVASPSAKRLIDEKQVDLRTYRVIYEVTDDLRKAMQGMLKPVFREEVVAHADVLDVFHTSSGTIAGCVVTDGELNRQDKARLLRDNVVVFENAIGSLRRFKDDVRTVPVGAECGIKLDGYDDVKKGDVIETFKLIEVEQTL